MGIPKALSSILSLVAFEARRTVFRPSRSFSLDRLVHIVCVPKGDSDSDWFQCLQSLSVLSPC